MIFSCCIPAKDYNDPSLKRLLDSIRAQDFPQDQIETIVVTEGDSESAKAIAIRKAKGEIVALFCADNEIVDSHLFETVQIALRNNVRATGVYSKYYRNAGCSLNRCLAYFGVNDPVPFYLGKADRKPWYTHDFDELFKVMCFKDSVPSLGDNGFFIRREIILKADLDHYYPMDMAEDLRSKGFFHYIRINAAPLVHHTITNLFQFLKRRFFYADSLYCKRNDRRWKMVEQKDIPSLIWFSFCALTIVQPLLLAIKGFKVKSDLAWFWWPVICFFSFWMYLTLGVKNCLTHPKQRLSFRALVGLNPSKGV